MSLNRINHEWISVYFSAFYISISISINRTMPKHFHQQIDRHTTSTFATYIQSMINLSRFRAPSGTASQEIWILRRFFCAFRMHRNTKVSKYRNEKLFRMRNNAFRSGIFRISCKELFLDARFAFTSILAAASFQHPNQAHSIRNKGTRIHYTVERRTTASRIVLNCNT